MDQTNYYWISYQIYDNIHGEVLPISEAAINKHPFEWIKSSKSVKHGTWTLINYKEITEKEYEVHSYKL